jgi:hypothetical protein
MQIVGGSVNLHSAHRMTTTHTRTERIEAWVGQRPAEDSGVTISLSDLARDAVEAAGEAMEAAGESLAETEGVSGEEEELAIDDLRMMVLVLLVEAVTGRKMELFDPSELEPSEEMKDAMNQLGEFRQTLNQGWGVEIEVEETHTRHEKARFSARAHLQTEDGRSLHIDLRVVQERFEESKQRWGMQFGEAPKDPLVLDFGAPAIRSSGEHQIDLDGDGTADALPHFGRSSMYLVDDRDGNGQVTDASELFGPRSGDGFAELRSLDSDGNGFIDAGDAAWSRLRVWEPGPHGGRLVALADKGVGALYTGDIATPFRLLAEEGDQQVAQQQAMSFWVGEDGTTAGTTRRVDVVS